MGSYGPSENSDQTGWNAQAELSLCQAYMPFCWFCHEVAHIKKVSSKNNAKFFMIISETFEAIYIYLNIACSVSQVLDKKCTPVLLRMDQMNFCRDCIIYKSLKEHSIVFSHIAFGQ